MIGKRRKQLQRVGRFVPKLLRYFLWVINTDRIAKSPKYVLVDPSICF